MKFSKIAMSSIVAIAIAMPSFVSAQEIDLGTPIVTLMPHLKKLRTELDLNDQQNATIDNWLAGAPAKRKEIESEVIAIRMQLRDAILDGSERIHREELKKQLAEKNTRLIEMRSLCTRMLRNTLNEEQFAKVVDSYRAG
jgi:hypothetical protein